jgi:hypothetical protein
VSFNLAPPLVLDGDDKWPSRADLREALDANGYTLHPDMSVTVSDVEKAAA